MARYFNPVAQILTDSGRIAPGAKINFYVNNDTSTRQNTYADANLSVVNPNPVVMGADGRPQHEIFLPDDAIYTLVFTYSDDVQFAQVDDYTGANSDVVGILAGLGITISASELQIDLDVDLNGDLDISGTPKISTNNVALTGVASSGFPPADIPLIKANASDQVEIDPDGNGTLVSGTLDASGLVSLIYTDDSGATGLKLGTAGVASGYIFSDDNISIDIDHNNNSSGASFNVTKDSGATTLLSISETGNSTFSGDATINASHLFFDGAGSAPTLSSNGDATMYGSGANGALIRGRGSVNDVAIFNQSGLNALIVPANTQNVTIAGALSKGSGSFRIDHPLKPETHQLVHSFTESPQADLLYSGKSDLVDGKAVVNIDEVHNMTTGTFEALCRDIRVFTTNEDGWDLVRGSVVGNILTLQSENEQCSDTVSWLVIGERHDSHMFDTDWTDDNGRVIVEPEKPAKVQAVHREPDLDEEGVQKTRKATRMTSESWRVVDGKAIRIPPVEEDYEEPLWLEYPKFDESGDPIYED